MTGRVARTACAAAAPLLGVALLLTLPVWLGHHTFYVNIASQILLWAVAALALNVLVGYAGLVSLGHAGLLAVAAYTVGLVLQAGAGHLLACLAAIGVTLAASAVFALLALRSTGIGFLMITLALGQIVWGIAYRWASLTNGDNGINVSTRPAPFGISLSSAGSFYLATLVVFLIAVASMAVFVRSPFGAAIVVIMKNVVSAYIERWNLVLGVIFILIISFMPEGLVPGSVRLWRAGWRRIRGQTSSAQWGQTPTIGGPSTASSSGGLTPPRPERAP